MRALLYFLIALPFLCLLPIAIPLIAAIITLISQQLI